MDDEFFYILTIQAGWNAEPRAQCTIRGTIRPAPGETREMVLAALENQAIEAWYARHRHTSSDGFAVIFFSLEKNSFA